MTLLQDLRFSLRLLAKTPGFTATAVLVLALGIGVNTGLFSVIHAFAYSDRPFPASEQVVQLYSQDRQTPTRYRTFSYPTFRDVREQAGEVFSDLLAYNIAMVGVGEGTTTRRTFTSLVSSNFFDVLGVPLQRGRAFTPAEEEPGAAVPVVIASHLFWQRHGLDPALVGSTLRINERPFTVIGITPPGFTGTSMLIGPELYFPLGVYDLLRNDYEGEQRRTLDQREGDNLIVVGRLRPGVSPATADAALATIATRLEAAWPVALQDQTFHTGVLPRLSVSNAPVEEGEIGTVGLLLLGMTAIVLLIASLNLANMLLARGAARRKEFAIRLALGGGRGRIIRQLLTEGLVLSLLGGAVGLALALWSADLLMGAFTVMMPVPIFFSGTPDAAILAATLGFSALATLFFALGPALKLSGAGALADLKEQAGEDVRRRRWLPRHPLVVAQVALSLGLLVCAGLFIRGALNAGGADLGFAADDTLILEVDASLGGYDEPRARAELQAVQDRLAALPGVRAAAVASTTPFGFVTIGRPVQRAGFNLGKDDRPASAAEGLAFSARWNSVGAAYFDALGLPVLRGRAFTAAECDAPGAPRVAVIDEALARKLWPDGDALGQRIQFANPQTRRGAGGAGGGTVGANESLSAQPGEDTTMEVVGIVPSIRTNLARRERGPAIYVPFAQGFRHNVYFHVRPAAATPAAAAALVETARREVRATAPGLPLLSLRTFRQHLDNSADLFITRLGAILFALFGGLALLLAVVGLYGVKAYAVTRRTREIGIRMALGAAPGEVCTLILCEGIGLALRGVALGLLLAVGLGRLCASLLFEVSPLDPLSFTVAPLALLLTAFLACWLPARRATRVNPLQALRAD